MLAGAGFSCPLFPKKFALALTAAKFPILQEYSFDKCPVDTIHFMRTTVRALDVVNAIQHGVSIPKKTGFKCRSALVVTDRWKHQIMEGLISLAAVLLSVALGPAKDYCGAQIESPLRGGTDRVLETTVWVSGISPRRGIYVPDLGPKSLYRRNPGHLSNATKG